MIDFVGARVHVTHLFAAKWTRHRAHSRILFHVSKGRGCHFTNAHLVLRPAPGTAFVSVRGLYVIIRFVFTFIIAQIWFLEAEGVNLDHIFRGLETQRAFHFP